MKLSRRNFLKGTAALGATSVVAPSVAALNPVANTDEDYKALVCIFLLGGNDAYNMVIPDDDSAYAEYLSARPKLAIERSAAVPLGIKTDNNVALSLHPAMQSLQDIFAVEKSATVIVNTGQLVEPIIGRDQTSARYPEFLMAHNLQQTMWQSGADEMDIKLGWAGRMVEQMYLPGKLSPMISLGGEKKWLRNNIKEQLVTTSAGAGSYSGLTTADRVDAMMRHFNAQFANLYEDNYSATMASRYHENAQLDEALASVGKLPGFPDTGLGNMLHTTAQMIKARNSEAMGHRRQVFFLGLGGFDTHKDQLNAHAGLLKQVADAMAAFYHEIKQQGLSENVTTFTMSDFGRRIMPNETGTDHGWAGHQIIMGGAVQGGKAYGKWPALKPGSEYDYKNGRLIPEIAADQVNASLAQWFGYDDLPETLFASLSQFELKTIPFMAGAVGPELPDPPPQYPTYTAGTAYNEGDIVVGKDNALYQCKPWPYSGWCSNSGYAPGDSLYWQDAWNKI